MKCIPICHMNSYLNMTPPDAIWTKFQMWREWTYAVSLKYLCSIFVRWNCLTRAAWWFDSSTRVLFNVSQLVSTVKCPFPSHLLFFPGFSFHFSLPYFPFLTFPLPFQLTTIIFYSFPFYFTMQSAFSVRNKWLAPRKEPRPHRWCSRAALYRCWRYDAVCGVSNA